MPCTTIWIDVAISRLRQRQMRRSALLAARGAVHRRAHQRMREGDTLAHREQPARRRVVDGDPEALARA
jgi:hypothetical protein